MVGIPFEFPFEFVFISLTSGPLSHIILYNTFRISKFYAFTFSQNIADVPGENLVQLVDEHEHVAVLFYTSLDKGTKKVRMAIKRMMIICFC